VIGARSGRVDVARFRATLEERRNVPVTVST
jgi:hypothetical protein